jgi:uncharacterized protein (DUF2147 family)
MKRAFLVFALMIFVSSSAAISFAAMNGVKIEKNDDDKRKKKKKKRNGCCAIKQEGKSCCSKKESK